MLNKEQYEPEIIPIVEALGFKVVEIQLSQVKSGVKFVLFIYSQKGVTIDDCETVSHALASRLQALMKPGIEAILEVSSPGINRVFKSQSEYQIFIGLQVQFNFKNGQVAKGSLTEVTDEYVCIDDNQYRYNEIAKAKLI